MQKVYHSLVRPIAIASLILCNIVWSTHPSFGKIVLRSFAPEHAALLRYGSAFLAFVLVSALLGAKRDGPLFAIPRDAREGFWLLFLGLMTFSFAPWIAMQGLVSTQATQATLVIAMEPLITVAMAWLFLRDPFTRRNAAAFGVAILGFCLLAGLTPAKLFTRWEGTLLGNMLILLSLIGEGAYSVGARKLFAGFAPNAILASALGIGTLGLLVSCAFSSVPFALLTNPSIEWQAWAALLWLGPLGTAVGYWVWMKVLKEASVASMTLTLFIQPVLGAVWGRVFLRETLGEREFFGAVLILGAVATQSLWDLRSTRV